MSAGPLTMAQRAALARLAEAIALRTARMPSAGDLGLAVEGGLIDRALALRPDLAAALPAILDPAAGEEAETSLRRLQAENPAALSALMQAVAGAYYLHPEVRELIGYPGQQALGLGRGEIGGEDLLEAMMARPPRWRAAEPPPRPRTADAGR